MADPVLGLDEVQSLAQSALEGAGASSVNAASVARSTALAERDGIRSHGLLYVPIYAEHVQCGKVAGDAVPAVVQPRPGAVCVDAGCGFAHPAIDAGWLPLREAAHANGIAAMTVYNSYNCGVLGHHAERLAEDGLVGLCFTHAPASIAPSGGSRPVVGTNPFALAVPDGKGEATLVIDQSASVIAKSEIMLRAKAGEPIEPDWALDTEGRPTTDAQLALKGSMLPAGGHKGFGVGLLVEILASCLSGAVSSVDASPFSGTAGGPPRTGQCLIAIDPAAFSGAVFYQRIAALVEQIEGQRGSRVPGARRKENSRRLKEQGIRVDAALIGRIRGFVR
ncbi:Ldh family oxidoreductase [Nitratireductor sp. XY-223]|uniref:Ldh family oxidoreductase n=1 Tax=Nitratireductor sp. XY-223 TaxID=2561926 RepID=UPI0010A9ED69|nr:Ldh family oxidoreductase [Nitratireductor sp. XY-223]